MFKFELGQHVAIIESHASESGEVVGRSELAFAEAQSLVRYRAGDGRVIESWWDESALEAVVSEEICSEKDVACANPVECVAEPTYVEVERATARKLNAEAALLEAKAKALSD